MSNKTALEMQNVNKILLKRSAELVNGAAKQPTAQQIESGEIAMNYADGHESLFIKNSSDEIVKFSSDERYTLDKLGQRFQSTTVQEVIEENEEVVAAALTDLNDKLDDKADVQHTHIIGDVNGLQTALNGKAPTVHTHAITDVNGLQTALDGKASTSHTHTIANVNGLQDALDAKADESALTAHTANTTVHITSEERAKINNALTGLSFTDDMADVTITNGNASVDLNLPKSLRIMGITPSGHTLADAADTYYANSLGNEEVGAWFISYSNGSILLPSDDGSKDQSGRVALSSSWQSTLGYGGMTWANVGDILLVYKQSALVVVYKVLSINEAGETRIGLMSPNDKVQVNKISGIETTLNRRLPYSTDSTNIGNVGDGAYSNVTAGRDNWIDTSSGGAVVKLSPLQIGVDPSGRLYSRNTTKSAIWNLTNQLVTIGGTDLDTVHEPSVVGYGVCTNGPSTNPLTVYTFTSSDIDNNGYRSLLQIAIDRNTSAPYVRTTFYQPNGGGFSKTDWVQVTDDYNNLKNKPTLDFVTTATFNAHTADTTVHVSTADRTKIQNALTGATLGGVAGTVTNNVVALAKPTYTAAEVGALPTGTTLDNVPDGTTRKLSNYATTAQVNTINETLTAHTGNSSIHVTTAQTQAWDNKISTVKVNNTALTPDANKAVNITVPTALSALTADASHRTVSDTEKATWNGKVNAADIADFFDGAEYVSSSHTINFKHGTQVKASIDANAFIKDGMVDNVTVSGGNLVITFNTDAGKNPITLPISSIFDANNYYTKTATDDLLDAKADQSALTAHTSDTDIHVTTAQTQAWDNAATNSHTHGNKGVLDNLTQTVIDNSHTHSNKATLDNLTQAVITNSHTHTNKAVLDGITSAKVEAWDAAQANVIEVVKRNGTALTITDKAVDVSVPTALSELSDDATHRLVTDTEKTTWNGKQNNLNGLKTINGSPLSGSTANLSLATQAQFTAHTANTTMHITAAERTTWNGKQDALTFDTVPTEGSENPCTSDGIYKALTDNELVISAALTDLHETKIGGVRVNGTVLTPDSDYIVDVPAPEFDYDTVPTSGSTNLVNSGDLYNLVKETELIISEALTDLDTRVKTVSGMVENADFDFDAAPTSGSTKLINSGTLYEVFDELEYATATALTELKSTKQNMLQSMAYGGLRFSHSNTYDEIGINAGNGLIVGANNILGVNVGTGLQVVNNQLTIDPNATGGLTGVTFNGTAATVNNRVAAITATIPAAPGTLNTTATGAQATNASEALSGNITLHKVSKTGNYNDLTNKPVIVSAATLNGTAATLDGDGHTLNFTVTLDNVGDGTDRKLSDYMHKSGDTTNTVQITTTGGTTGSGNLGGFLVTVAQGDTTGFAVQGKIGSDTGATAIISAHTTSTGAEVSLGRRGGYSDNDTIHLNGRVQKMVVGSTSRLLQANVATSDSSNGQAYDLVANKIAKGTFNSSRNQWDITGEFAALPSFTAADNGKILGIVNGALAWVTPTTIYTGTGTPSSQTGKDGDIYLQTS